MQPAEFTVHFGLGCAIWLVFSNMVLRTDNFVLGNFALMQEEM